MTDAVAAVVATEAQVRRLAQDWLRRGSDGRVLAVAARPQWSGPEVLEIEGVKVRVVACPSPIAVRAALVDQSTDERLVILTNVSEDELGVGLLAHMAKLRPVSIEPWELVRTQFGGADLDPALVREGRWLAEALIEHAPASGWPPVATVLTRDHALRSLTATLLGMPPTEIDSAGVLQWTTRSVEVVRYASLPAGLRDGIAAWLGETAGAAARWAMVCVGSGHGTDAISLGLLARLLWSPDLVDSPTALEARVRFENLLNGSAPTGPEATAWGEAAQAWVERVTGDPETAPLANRVLARVEELARQVKAESLLVRSDLLPAALLARLRDLAGRLMAAVDSRRPADVTAVEAAWGIVRRHQLARTDPRAATAEMAVRLLRWLTLPPPPLPDTLAEAVSRYVTADGWVDRAMLAVGAGDPDPHVAAAYGKLYATVDERRVERDCHFATLLAAATAAETPPGSMLRVEDVLSRVVRPILDSGRRVLLIVVDGMSVAASTDLVASITDIGWIEVTPAGGPRVGVLAALPTVTSVSRTSLLCGRITVGQQAEEKAGLAAATVPEARLLHRAELRSGPGASLDPAVISALADPQIRLVGAVINTIDDSLERSEPGTTEWNIQTTVRAVRDLLTHAKDRVVVLLSDHGHIVDRGTAAELRSAADGGARWRPATSPPGDGELLFRGSRVALGGGQVVLAWRETLRYAARKAGYHGGASPAEAVIPLAILTAGDETAVPGWAGAPVASPAWWRGPVTAAPTVMVPATADTLFDLAPEPAAPAQTPSLVTALLASPVYRKRQKMLGRGALDDDRVAAMLTALVTAGGRATVDSVAAAAQIPQHRARQTLGALRRLLQVDGYAVLDFDVDEQTVILDERLLRDQFELGARS